MDEKKTVGIGVGGTVVSLVLAGCPLHLAIFGALGMTGVVTSPWFESMEPFFVAGLVGFGALTLYGIVRLLRRNRNAATV